jgi:hypothetical protein
LKPDTRNVIDWFPANESVVFQVPVPYIYKIKILVVHSRLFWVENLWIPSNVSNMIKPFPYWRHNRAIEVPADKRTRKADIG